MKSLGRTHLAQFCQEKGEATAWKAVGDIRMPILAIFIIFETNLEQIDRLLVFNSIEYGFKPKPMDSIHVIHP